MIYIFWFGSQISSLLTFYFLKTFLSFFQVKWLLGSIYLCSLVCRTAVCMCVCVYVSYGNIHILVLCLNLSTNTNRSLWHNVVNQSKEIECQLLTVWSNLISVLSGYSYYLLGICCIFTGDAIVCCSLWYRHGSYLFLVWHTSVSYWCGMEEQT